MNDDVREALMRHVVASDQSGALYFFYTDSIGNGVVDDSGKIIRGDGLSNRLMARFTSDARVRSISQGFVHSHSGWHDKTSQKFGYLFWIGPIRRVKKGEVEIMGGNPGNAGTRCIYAYRFTRRQGRWEFASASLSRSFGPFESWGLCS
jgi:hypothetical protein